MFIFSAFPRPWKKAPGRVRALLAGLVLVAAAGAAWADADLAAEVRLSRIHVTPLEREIGDSWIPSLPPDSRILIEAGGDTDLVYPHYMYLEALHGAGKNERRILFAHHRFAYITPALPLDSLDLTGCRYVLRRRGVAGEVEGDLRPVHTNARYELLTAPLLFYYGSGFYGHESSPRGHSHWLRQDGRIVIVASRNGAAELSGRLSANPVLSAVKLQFRLNDADLGDAVEIDGSPWKLRLQLKAGQNTLVTHSLRDPKPPGDGDERPLAACFTGVRVRPVE